MAEDPENGTRSSRGPKETTTISIDLSPQEAVAEWVLHPEPSTELFSVGEQHLLYSPNQGASLIIDPMGAAVWQCFDGTATLGEIANDLSEVSNADHDQAFGYLKQFSRQLTSAGVLGQGPWQPQEGKDDGRLANPPNR